MMDEEKSLTPNPEPESEPVLPAAESETEWGPEDETPEVAVQASEDVTGFDHERVVSGPLSEEIRVYNIRDFKEKTEEPVSDQANRAESSIRNVSQEQRIMGKVVAIHDDEVLMDVGFKSEGVIDRDEFEQAELPRIGDEIEVLVEVLENEHGQMILSKRKADFMRIWERVKQIHQNSETIDGRIVNRIKGGMVVDVMGIDAFLPGSQIDIRPVLDFDAYVGKNFEFRIVKLNELRKNIVLSRKELLEESLKEKRDELLSQIKVGDVMKGRVKNITDFGVFIDLGGLDGLLHITDLSWGRVNHPKEVVKMDDELSVKVIDYDPVKQRVSLGLKQLTRHPWEGIEEKYPVGTTVEGRVVNIANYGVFVEIEKGVEGLIHISEISWTQHIKHPSEKFNLGEQVHAKVLSIDSSERKISLGYKQLEPDPWESIEERYTVGTIHTVIVRNMTQYGAFVELEEGIDGFVHISEISWTKKVRHPRELLHRDEEIQVKITEVSKESRKITVSLKQVEEDPWPVIETLYSEGSLVDGEVVRITDKFIIVKLNYGIEGIVPVGQMPKQDRKNVGKKVQIGEVMQLKVLEVSRNDKKIVLSREQAIPKKPKTEVEAYMMQQPDSSEKIAIPDEIIEKIQQSEQEEVVPADTSEEKPKAAPRKRSRTRATEPVEEMTLPAEQPETSEPVTEKPKRKSKTVKAESESETEVAEPKPEAEPTA